MEVEGIAADDAVQRSTTQHSVVDKTQNIDNAIIRHAEHDRVPGFVHPFRWIGNLIPAVPSMVHANARSKRAQPFDAVTLWIVGEITHRLDEESGVALAANFVEP
jgi:hypothetical protein